MHSIDTSCSRCVGGNEKSPCCKGVLIKHGFTKAGKTRYKCKQCSKTRVALYTYKSYLSNIDADLVKLTIEGLGIRSTSRVLQISPTTVLKRLLMIASQIAQPPISKGKIFEVDEMRTYVRSKDRLFWIVCAYERESKKIVSFFTGPRSNKTLDCVLRSLKLANAQKIYTDGLRNYKYLIDKAIHQRRLYGTNHIERTHLTIRTHLKRLNRKTICFTRSAAILTAILKIYFWGQAWTYRLHSAVHFQLSTE